MGLVKRAVVGVIASRAEKEPEALAGIERTFRAGYIAEMNTQAADDRLRLDGSTSRLAAWMLDHDPDSYAKISKAFLDGKPTGGLTRDHVLDNITLYWLTNTSTSAARLYWENFQTIVAAPRLGAEAAGSQAADRVHGLPQELFKAPRSWAEKVYPNLTYFNEVDRRAATSPPGRSRRSSPRSCATRSGRCADRERGPGRRRTNGPPLLSEKGLNESHRDPATTVVLVHGAFADASSWNGVIERLQAKGVQVTAPANPLRGLTFDSAYLAGVLEQTRARSWSATPTAAP